VFLFSFVFPFRNLLYFQHHDVAFYTFNMKPRKKNLSLHPEQRGRVQEKRREEGRQEGRQEEEREKNKNKKKKEIFPFEFIK